MIWNFRCTVTIDSVLANSKTQNAFLFAVNAIFFSRLPPSGGTWKYAKAPNTNKTWRDSLPIDMLLSAVSVLVVAQSSSEIQEGLMNNPVYSECVSVALGIQDTTNMRRIILSSAACLALPYSSTYLFHGTIFGQKVTENKTPPFEFLYILSQKYFSF